MQDIIPDLNNLTVIVMRFKFDNFLSLRFSYYLHNRSRSTIGFIKKEKLSLHVITLINDCSLCVKVSGEK